jgi:hypothetical protein
MIENETFEYLDLKAVDPNYTPVEEEVYTLKVIKFVLAKTKGDNGKTVKPYLQATFAITNHTQNNGRRLFHSFWNIQDNNSFDAKALKRVSAATGINQDGGFTAWVEKMSLEQPIFKALVKKQNATQWNKEKQVAELKLDPVTQLPIPENVIDFRNVEIA